MMASTSGRPLSAGRAGAIPVIVNVHGGYWRRGSRNTFQYWGPYLAERGYAGFTISYRLTKPGKKTYPEVVNDVRAAVQFMRGRPRNFGLIPIASRCGAIRPARILPPWWRLRAMSPLFAGAYPQDPHAAVSTKVKVLIGVYGIYDLLAQWRHSQIVNPGDNLVECLLGVSPTRIRRIYFEASPDQLRDHGQQQDRGLSGLGDRGRRGRPPHPVAGIPARAQTGGFRRPALRRAWRAALLAKRPDRRAGQSFRFPRAAAAAVPEGSALTIAAGGVRRDLLQMCYTGHSTIN